jgi:hypothetical protein
MDRLAAMDAFVAGFFPLIKGDQGTSIGDNR